MNQIEAGNVTSDNKTISYRLSHNHPIYLASKYFFGVNFFARLLESRYKDWISSIKAVLSSSESSPPANIAAACSKIC